MEEVKDYVSEGVRNDDLYEKDKSRQRYLRDVYYATRTSMDSFTNRPAVENYLPIYEDYGESKYDELTTTPDQYIRYQDIRAENQPWYSKLSNGNVKGATTTVTTALMLPAMLIGGSSQAIYDAVNGNDTSKRGLAIWDNWATNFLTDVNEWMEKQLPNYYTQEEQMNPMAPSSIFSANFVGDVFIKNMGFSIGSVYSGAAFSKLLSIGKAAKIPNVARGIISSVVAAGSEAAVEANNNSRQWLKQAQERIELDFENDLQNDYNNLFLPREEDIDKRMWQEMGDLKLQYQQLSRTGNYSIQDLNTFASNDIQKIKNKYANEKLNLQKEYYNLYNQKLNDKNKALERAELDAANMGNHDFWYNIPILTASTWIQFGSSLAGGWKNNIRSSKIFETEEGKGWWNKLIGGKKFAENAKVFGTKKATGMAIGKGLFRGGSEALEEISQQLASDWSGEYYNKDLDNYYKSLYDQQANIDAAEWGNAMADALHKTFVEDWQSTTQQGLVGFITGMLGIPVFGKRIVNNSSETWGKTAGGRFAMVGGMKGALNSNKLRYQQDLDLVEMLNKRVQEDPDFLNYWEGIVRNNFFAKKMDEAVKKGDILEFKNHEHSQMVNDIAMFYQAGKINDLIELVKAITDATSENIEAIKQLGLTQLDENIEYQKLIDERNKKAIEITSKKNEIISQLTENEQLTGEQAEELQQKLEEIDEESSKMLAKYDNKISELQNKFNKNGKKIGVFADENGNEFDEDEIRDILQKNQKDILKAIKTYTKTSRKIDEQTGAKLKPDQLAHLTWLKLHSENFKERGLDLAKQIQSDLIPHVIDIFRNKIEEDRKQLETEKDANKKSDVEKAIKKAEEELSKYIELSNSTKEDKLMGLAGNGAYLTALILSNKELSDILGDNKLDILQTTIDAQRLYNAYTDYLRYMQDYLAEPKKLDEAKEKAKEKAEKEAEKEEKKKSQEEIIKQLENANSYKEFRDILDNYEGDKEEFVNSLVKGENKKLKSYSRQWIEINNIRKQFDKFINSDNTNDFDEEIKNLARQEFEEIYKNSETTKQVGEGLKAAISKKTTTDGMEEINKKLNEFFDKFRQFRIDAQKNPNQNESKNKSNNKDNKEKKLEEGKKPKSKSEPAESSQTDTSDSIYDEVYEDGENTQLSEMHSWSTFTKYLFEPLKPENGRQAKENKEYSPEKVSELDALGAYAFVDNGELAKVFKKNNNTVIYYIVPPKGSKLDGEILLAIKQKTDTSIEIDGGHYQIVGVLGYNSKSNEGEESYRKIIQDINNEVTKNEQYHVSQKYTNNIKTIYSGRIVKTDNEELQDVGIVVNGKKYGKDYVFAIYNKKDGLHVLGNTSIDSGDLVSLNTGNTSRGNNSLWLYSKGADGRWYPKAITIKLFNVDEYDVDATTPVMTKIRSILHDIFDNNKSVEERNLAVEDLKDLLYFAGKSDIHVNSDGSVYLTDYKEDDITPNFGNDTEANETMLLSAIMNFMDLRFYISTATNPQFLIENNILATDIKQLEHVNASFDLYLNNTDENSKNYGKPIKDNEPAPTTTTTNNPQTEPVTHKSVTIGTKRYAVYSDGKVLVNGKEITDEQEIAHALLAIDIENGVDLLGYDTGKNIVYVGRYKDDKEFGLYKTAHGYKLVKGDALVKAKDLAEKQHQITEAPEIRKKLHELLRQNTEHNEKLISEILEVLEKAGIKLELLNDDKAIEEELYKIASPDAGNIDFMAKRTYSSQIDFAKGVRKPQGIAKSLLSNAIMTQANTFLNLTEQLKENNGSVIKKVIAFNNRVYLWSTENGYDFFIEQSLAINEKNIEEIKKLLDTYGTDKFTATALNSIQRSGDRKIRSRSFVDTLKREGNRNYSGQNRPFSGQNQQNSNGTGIDGNNVADIESQERRDINYLSTPEGDIYGFVYQGRIYLNISRINPNSLVHEYTHLWCQAVREHNPELWQNIKDLLQNDDLAKALSQELKFNNAYKNLSDDKLAEEVIAHLSGANGREKLEKIQNELKGETKGLFKKLVEQIKQLWKWVGENVFNLKSFSNINELQDRILYDLVSGTNLNNKDNDIISFEEFKEKGEKSNQENKNLKDVFSISDEEDKKIKQAEFKEKARIKKEMRTQRPFTYLMYYEEENRKKIKELQKSGVFMQEQNPSWPECVNGFLDYLESKGYTIERVNAIKTQNEFDALIQDLRLPEC